MATGHTNYRNYSTPAPHPHFSIMEYLCRFMKTKSQFHFQVITPLNVVKYKNGEYSLYERHCTAGVKHWKKNI